MAETRISEQSLLAGLNDIRLPAEATGGFTAELVVVVALALIAVVAVSGLMSIVARRPRRAPPLAPLAQRVAALNDLPDAYRAVALLHLLRSERPDLVPQGTLYSPQNFPDPAELETLLLRPEAQNNA